MSEERFASRADAQAEVDRLNEAADEETGAEVLGDGAATVVECPGAHARTGAIAWLRHYWPSLYRQLRAWISDASLHT